MRDIIFRGKRLDNGEWAYGDFEYNRKKDVARIHTYDENGDYEEQYIVDNITVGQYIGLKDKDGKEIYEGDVLALPANRREEEFESIGWEALYPRYVCLYAVVYSSVDCGFGFCSPMDALKDNPYSCGIATHNRLSHIGNIHDNPELLERR